MKYTILKHANLIDMVKHVEETIKDGWLPLGGVSVGLDIDARGASSRFYVQAMLQDPRNNMQGIIYK